MNPDPERILTPNGQSGRMPSIRPPLVLLILAVLGNVFVTRAGLSRAGEMLPYILLGQALNAAIWVGAVWLGALLAYRAIVSARS